MKLMVSKHGLMDHQQQVVLGDTYDQQGTEGAEVFQEQMETAENAGRKSLLHMQSGQQGTEGAEVLQE